MMLLALLRLPEANRPHFITIYYDEPDHEGHEFGPDAAADQGRGPEGGCAGRQVEGGARFQPACPST